MLRHSRGALAALAAVLVLASAACSSSGAARPARTPGPSLPPRPAASSYNQGLRTVVRPSAVRGGTLTLDLAGSPDSLDYQDTNEPFVWDLARLYSMQLLTYRSCPGACGRELVPDLATSLGQVSDHGLVWTYHLRPGVRFQNGQAITAADVKYGIERSYARAVLPYGPGFFEPLLADPGYPGPYADPGGTLTSITTPGPGTIQFHLLAPFADFDYVAASIQSTPVPPGWDSGRHRGASFQLDPISSGPYELQSYAPGRRLVLVPNPYWTAADDPQARQLPARIVVSMGSTPAAVDASLLAGTADADLGGTGLQAPAAASVLAAPALKSNADDALSGLVTFAYVNVRLIPDVHCRAAIEYAADKSALQSADGGPAAAAIASTLLPPNITGYQESDPYGALSTPGGAVAAAKQQLRLCGKPGGFTTGLAHPAGQPQAARAAAALRQSLARAGITVRLAGFPAASYYTAYAGSPSYLDAHGFGIALGDWRAAWPDGYAFLDELSDGSAIAYSGNANIAQLDDPVINSLFSRAARAGSAAAAAAFWPRIDARIMALAAILPISDQRVLLYRNPRLTNVYVDQAYGMYNYAVLGLAPPAR
ncbi:MAG: ABC transporter substrate-binding protein [Streptosporangiaceae bacterium]